jgi:hypothetical protein
MQKLSKYIHAEHPIAQDASIYTAYFFTLSPKSIPHDPYALALLN